jgi:hypothetical protein
MQALRGLFGAVGDENEAKPLEALLQRPPEGCNNVFYPRKFADKLSFWQVNREGGALPELRGYGHFAAMQ